jgi:hypothetical protein
MTELAQDGEFQVAAALPLATAPPIARDCDGAADDGVESRHVREGYVFRPARFFENGTQAHEIGARATGLPYRLTHRCGRRPEGPELLAPI